MLILAKFDHKISLAIHNVARKNDALHTVAVIFARWVFWALLIGIGGVIYLQQGPIYVAELIRMTTMSLIVGFIGNLWLGKIFMRKRPFVTHKLHALIPTNWLGTSFPSDHAMLSFALATPLFVVNPAAGILALAVAGCIGVSRVGVGVHYVSDVVVGSAVGIIATALAVFFVAF